MVFLHSETTRPIASSQVASRSLPPSRTSGRVSRAALLLACQPCSPLGPSRPLLTRSVLSPRTPTIFPPLTPTSSPHPLEHSTQHDRTPSSGSSATSRSTRPGHLPPPRNGVRGPH